MSCVGFLILFGLSCMFVSSKGQIILPPDGNSLTVLNGSTVRIEWSIAGSVSAADIIIRSWVFIRSGGKKTERLGEISSGGTITILTKLYEVDIKEPATLILKNVNGSYNGKYQFTLLSPGNSISEVDVVIAETPKVRITNCFNPVTVNESNDLTCVCRSEGGNPPANLTWYKDGQQMGKASYGENSLTLTSVTKQDIGTYKCVAQSYTLTDEESIEVKVRLNFKPDKAAVTFTKNPAVVGENVAVMCKSNSVPESSYTMFHNDTKLISNTSTYTIDVVQYSDAGTYKCITRNKLGNDSASNNLTVVAKVPPPTLALTTPSHKITTGTTNGNKTGKASSDDTSCGTEWYIVVVSVVSGIIMGLFLAYIVACSRRKFRNRKPQSNPETQTTEVDTTYQELDLSKMNTEENYQSLRVNAESNDAANDHDEDSTYTELSKTRDVENNYQSLT